MSEKHLTELPWKALAKQQKITKDMGLAKALADYYNAPETDHAARLAAIEEIKTGAKKLKKEHDGNEVGDYLDEVIAQAEKTRKAVEALAKTAAKDKEDGQDDEEAAEYKKDLPAKLKSALNQVKSRAPGAAEAGGEVQPQLKFMAFVAGKSCAVLVARKVGRAAKKLLPDIAGVAGGGKFHKGECVFEKNVHTFVLDQVPAGLARKLGKALPAETGMKYKVRVRSTDGSVDLDSDTDADPDDIPDAPPPRPVSLDEQWKQLKLALYPYIKKTLEANPPNRAEILRLAGEASKQEKTANAAGAGTQEREGGFRAAIAAFTELRPLLADAPVQDSLDSYHERLAALAPRLRYALSEQLDARGVGLRAGEGECGQLQVGDAGARRAGEAARCG